MSDPEQRTLGQVAYEKHAQVFRISGRTPAWVALKPTVRAQWETIATAVLEACGSSGG